MQTFTLTRGLDLPLAGAPAQRIEDAPPCPRVAVLGPDHHGLKPTVLVQPGDRVRRGQPVIEDKALPGVHHVAPGAGVVSAVNRGERRALLSVVIDLDGDDAPDAQVAFDAFKGRPVEGLSGAEVRALLLESGMWSALVTRPYSKTPAADAIPDAIFVTATDTRPHAPAPALALEGRMEDFKRGVAALAKLTSGTTYVCVGPEGGVEAPDIAAVEVAGFAGPHPAGNPGTHIHMLRPVDLGRTVWHVNYQDAAAIGRLFGEGVLDVGRVVSLAGPAVREPRLLRTRLGADLEALTRGELAAGEVRVISGSVLDGRTATEPALAFLGRRHLQVSALHEAVERELFGWIRPGGEKFSIWGVVLNAFRKDPSLALTTTTNGGHRAMVPIGSFERVMPLDLMPTFLLRALIMDDIERAEALGALELDEEDLALCTFVCPGKEEYGPLLRAMLNRIEKEAA